MRHMKKAPSKRRGQSSELESWRIRLGNHQRVDCRALASMRVPPAALTGVKIREVTP